MIKTYRGNADCSALIGVTLRDETESSLTLKPKLEKLLEMLRQRDVKGAAASQSHLNTALYDWNIERNWVNPNAFIITNHKGYAFFTFTKRDPRHCTLRHIFVLEEHRGENIGKLLMEHMYSIMQGHDVERLRFYANKPAIIFYERLGFKWLGENKQGLPFTFTDIKTMDLVFDQKQLKKLHKVFPNNTFDLK